MVPELDANRVRKWAHDQTPPELRDDMRVELDETPRGHDRHSRHSPTGADTVTDDIITLYDGVLEHIAGRCGVIRFERHPADDVNDVSGAQYAALGFAAPVSAS